MNNINYELLTQMQNNKRRGLTFNEYRKYIDTNIDTKKIAYNYLSKYSNVFDVTQIIDIFLKNNSDTQKFDTEKIKQYITNNYDTFKEKNFIALSFTDISKNIL